MIVSSGPGQRFSSSLSLELLCTSYPREYFWAINVETYQSRKVFLRLIGTHLVHCQNDDTISLSFWSIP